MREILFRGKSKITKKWLFGDLKECDGRFFIHPKDGNHHNFCHDEVDPKTVGQYTGLKDKNGFKIFEGDVIAREERKDIYGNVYFDDELSFKWQIPLCGALNERIAGSGNRYDKVGNRAVVIGNIHDNPELLEES